MKKYDIIMSTLFVTLLFIGIYILLSFNAVNKINYEYYKSILVKERNYCCSVCGFVNSDSNYNCKRCNHKIME